MLWKGSLSTDPLRRRVTDYGTRLWQGMRHYLSPNAQSAAAEKAAPPEESPPDGGADHLELAKESLKSLLTDPRVPAFVRNTLAHDYENMEELLTRLEQEHIHIAVCGRVSVGKSALLNALLGEERFIVSPRHGSTRQVQRAHWEEVAVGGVFIIDTPGINELGGEDRERMAIEVAERSDLVLFVVDGDLTDAEFNVLRTLISRHRPLLLILNKADRYTRSEREEILTALAGRTQTLLPAQAIVSCSARPAARVYIQLAADGSEQESWRQPGPDVAAVRDLLWEIIEIEGKTLAALNASLFAGRLSDQVARRITQLKREMAEKLVRTYCIGKGVAVAFNPIPLADLLSVAADGAMIVHLGRLYGLPVTTGEAGGIIRVIIGQMALLMSAVYSVHLASSALKGISAGFSTVVTAGVQGAAAYYSTYVVGRAAESYFAQGKSWGPGGPKQTIQEIMDSLDSRSILLQGREEILARIREA